MNEDLLIVTKGLFEGVYYEQGDRILIKDEYTFNKVEVEVEIFAIDIGPFNTWSNPIGIVYDTDATEKASLLSENTFLEWGVEADEVSKYEKYFNKQYVWIRPDQIVTRYNTGKPLEDCIKDLMYDIDSESTG